jgi:alkanesulfonate monooxygenase SsuD/methylene tetrahydromethanopterin reductase-like flavin-dependent oxidoreductase (luciferase family)
VLLFYVTSPAYRLAWTWHGFAREMAGAQLALEARNRESLRAAITDELVDSIALIGDPDDIRKKITEYRQAGVTTLSLGPVDQQSLDFVVDDLASR